MMPAVAFSFFSLAVILYFDDTFYYSSRKIFLSGKKIQGGKDWAP